MQNTINGLIGYASSSNRELELKTVDCQALVAEIVGDLRADIDASGGQVDWQGLPSLRADDTMLRQCFQNLITNALKFHAPECKPYLIISAEKKEDGWRFCFADNGIGIDADQLEAIFTPLKRLRSRAEFPGTGLGLASARNAISALGGHIWAESEPGRGTRFLVQLPESAEQDSHPES